MGIMKSSKINKISFLGNVIKPLSDKGVECIDDELSQLIRHRIYQINSNLNFPI